MLYVWYYQDAAHHVSTGQNGIFGDAQNDVQTVGVSRPQNESLQIRKSKSEREIKTNDKIWNRNE